MMSLEEYELFEIMRVVYNLENNTGKNLSDYKYALSEMYEIIDGYYGYTSEIEEFALDENGGLITHSIEEYKSFLDYIYQSMLGIYVRKMFPLNKEQYKKGYLAGLEQGRIEGYQGRDMIAELEEDVQSYR